MMIYCLVKVKAKKRAAKKTALFATDFDLEVVGQVGCDLPWIFRFAV
jgi:hypothetical protein